MRGLIPHSLADQLNGMIEDKSVARVEYRRETTASFHLYLKKASQRKKAKARLELA